jgi:hypothetical protein
MKIESLLLGAALSLAAQVACAKPHGDDGAKGAHGLSGSFAEGVSGKHDHGAPPLSLGFGSNFETGAWGKALELGDHDLDGDADNDQKIHAALSNAAPVPEPETYALMLAGLAAIGLIGRRKMNR